MANTTKYKDRVTGTWYTESSAMERLKNVASEKCCSVSDLINNAVSEVYGV